MPQLPHALTCPLWQQLWLCFIIFFLWLILCAGKPCYPHQWWCPVLYKSTETLGFLNDRLSKTLGQCQKCFTIFPTDAFDLDIAHTCISLRACVNLQDNNYWAWLHSYGEAIPGFLWIFKMVFSHWSLCCDRGIKVYILLFPVPASLFKASRHRRHFPHAGLHISC